jgi:hypothetical protein
MSWSLKQPDFLEITYSWLAEPPFAAARLENTKKNFQIQHARMSYRLEVR